jgi:putative transposase
MGLLLRVIVHPANLQDRDGALLVLCRLASEFPRLRLIWADGGYAGQLIDWVLTALICTLVIIKRSDDTQGFQVLPRRWVVERTFAWLGGFRRLSKDYEELPRVSEAFIYAAMVHLMLRRLAA